MAVPVGLVRLSLCSGAKREMSHDSRLPNTGTKGGLRGKYLPKAQIAAYTAVFPGKILWQNRKLAYFEGECQTVLLWGNRQIRKEWALLCASFSVGVVRE